MKNFLLSSMLLFASVIFGQATLVYHFPFNNSLSAAVGSGTLSSNNPVFSSNGSDPTGAVFVDVQDNNASRAANRLTGNLPLLPQTSADKSIALRVKFTSFSGNNLQYVLSWGSAQNTRSFGFSAMSSVANADIWGGNAVFLPSPPLYGNVWYNIIIRKGVSTTGMYINGVAYTPTVATNRAGANTTGTDIVFGTTLAADFGAGSFMIDDLKIYNGLMTQAQIDEFNTPAPAPATLVYHFPFNGNFNSIVNTATLTATTPPNFVSNGTTNNSAAEIRVAATAASRDTNALSAINLTLLPNGNAPRSVAFRVRFDTGVAAEHYIFGWGTAFESFAFIGSQLSTDFNVNAWGAGNQKSFSNTVNSTIWYDYAITYDGSFSRVYRDGVQIGTPQAQNLITDTKNLFIGKALNVDFGQGEFLLDDLKIYTGVLTQAEIITLSQSTSLANSDFSNGNLKFNLYPNPASTILNIDTTSDLKSVEIYSMLGQKVLSATTKKINVSSLSNGIYVMRLEDIDGAIQTQRFIKE
jgi:Secretion system C-terminal sorting domain/Concanavalin A-like lectin/glucanases superfamily